MDIEFDDYFSRAWETINSRRIEMNLERYKILKEMTIEELAEDESVTMEELEELLRFEQESVKETAREIVAIKEKLK